MLLRSLILASALALPITAAAQQAAPARPPATAADIDPTTLVRNAMQVLAAVDQGQLGSLYDGASSAARGTVARNDFINNISRQRQALGVPTSRTWWSVTRQVIPAGVQAPAGNYMSVRFASQFAGGKSAGELVSFRLDEDGTWRMAGYAIQQ